MTQGHRRRITYRAEPVTREADGERYRIVRTVDAPASVREYVPRDDRLVAELRADQAEDLLESLATALEAE